MERYVLTMITSDGEDVLATVPPRDVKYPRYDVSITWSDYQKVLAKWLERNAIELGEVADQDEEVTFVVYKLKR